MRYSDTSVYVHDKLFVDLIGRVVEKVACARCRQRYSNPFAEMVASV